MNPKSIKAWLAQTSTKTALVSIATIAATYATHQISRDAAIAAAVPMLFGLIFEDNKTLAAEASSIVAPIAQALADKPTVAAVEAAVAKEIPAATALAESLTGVSQVPPSAVAAMAATPAT